MTLVKINNTIYNLDHVTKISETDPSKLRIRFSDGMNDYIGCTMEEFERAVVSAAKMVHPNIVEIKSREEHD